MESPDVGLSNYRIECLLKDQVLRGKARGEVKELQRRRQSIRRNCAGAKVPDVKTRFSATIQDRDEVYF